MVSAAINLKQVCVTIGKWMSTTSVLAEKLDETPEYAKGLKVLNARIPLVESRTLRTDYRR